MGGKINAVVDAISFMLVLIVFIYSRRQGSCLNRLHNLLNALMFCIMAILMIDIPAWLLNGQHWARSLCIVLDTAFYIAQITYCRLWFSYVDNCIIGSRPRSKAHHAVVSIPMAVEIVMIVMTPFTGWIFIVSPENIYSRGELYNLSLIPYFFYIILSAAAALFSALKFRCTKKGRQSLSILAYMFFPACGTVIQTAGYGYSWIWPFAAISLLMVYLNLLAQEISDKRIAAVNESARATTLENELADCRLKIMLSQIQPHFLYNSLAVIQALCETDPEAAASATQDFSVYLHCNMESLNAERLIPFEKELQHTVCYLSLEALRFQNRLEVRYDIQATDFSIPALTLQPLAENAVRRGITKLEDGGSLLISSRKAPDGFVIVISNTGAGLEPSSCENAPGEHIGIANIEMRLKSLCDGTLTLKNSPGSGTEATIFIPAQLKEISE